MVTINTKKSYIYENENRKMATKQSKIGTIKNNETDLLVDGTDALLWLSQ